MKKMLCIFLVFAILLTPYTSFFANDITNDKADYIQVIKKEGSEEYDRKEIYELLLKNIEELKTSNYELKKKILELEKRVISEKESVKKLNKFESTIYQIIKFTIKTIGTVAIYITVFYVLSIFLKKVYIDTGCYQDSKIYLECIQPVMHAVSIINKFFKKN